MKLFKDYMLAIVTFCAEECKRQGSGEESVAWMVNAYNYATARFAVDQNVTEEDKRDLARLIEPGCASPQTEGNGRLDAILFNVKNGTLYKPVPRKV